MQQSRVSNATLIRFVVAVALFAVGCARTPPEQAVRQQVEAMQAAIHARDAGAIEDLLAGDFIGNDGIDRRGARQLAAAIFLRHRSVGANLGAVSVELRGQADAMAKFSVLATGGSGGVLPESGQLYRVETGWRLVDGEWKMLNARWEPSP
ncbi:MAG: nuclear transport factor 2 family protein [Lysobacteraceae bacterium]|nr:MAG: nuclear transport factor 2 family protein [Xanthomonadaceae bacterium]